MRAERGIDPHSSSLIGPRHWSVGNRLVLVISTMRFALLAFASSALGISVPSWPSTGVDAFQASQYPISKAGILANIGPNGSKDQGAYKGVVIASPSKVDPDYVYTCVSRVHTL
jgi:glucoamylase